MALAVAAIGAGTATGAPDAQASPAHHRQHARYDTHLTAHAPGTVEPGSSAVVAGRLTARRIPLADRSVRLLVKHDGSDRWVLGRIGRTDRAGRVGFRVSPDAGTAYQLWFLGSGSFQPARSRAVTVAPRDVAVTIAATPPVVDPGGSAVVGGTVTRGGAPLADAAVQLRARKAGTHRAFEPVAAGVTAADGSVSFPVTPVRSTAYVLVVPRTGTTQAARSSVAKVVVRATSRIAVRARTFRDTYSVVGYLYSHGKGLAGRTVTLQSQASGATDWTDVKSKRTARDGYVDFRLPLAEGTSYRLVWVGTDHVSGSTSRTVVA